MKKIISKDAQAVNFREVCIGNIAPGMLYRSSHPIEDLKQEKTVALLAAKARIAAVVNLSDSKSGIEGKAIFAPWYNKLLKNGKVIALNMDFSVTGANFKKKLKKGLQFILKSEGPWLIHCHAGVDRTGFVSMVLESFMDAPLDEVIDDYLESFNSIFESSCCEEENTADSRTAKKILSVMNDLQEITAENLQRTAENYLRNTIRLSAEETEMLKLKLSGKTK